jgi:hypothetical protein
MSGNHENLIDEKSLHYNDTILLSAYELKSDITNLILSGYNYPNPESFRSLTLRFKQCF